MPESNTSHVRIFYPADPVGVVPGGIDTFLRGLLKWGPAELEFSLVGMSTDLNARPLHQWTTCDLGRRSFDFWPVVHVADAAKRSRIPLSARYTWGLQTGPRALRQGFEVFDFHRLEPAWLFRNDARPKNAFFHQDPVVVRAAQSDIIWSRMPAVYEWVEKQMVRSLSAGWCVRETGVRTLAKRYPSQASQFRFISTWVDTEVFSPLPPEQRAAQRAALAQEWGWRPDTKALISVGRLDTQKDPALMYDAFARLVAQGRDLAWLVVGDGVLRADLQARAQADGLASRIHFLGLKSAAQIAPLLGAVDVYTLSSAYEGMPMALLEGMGCGLPVATTDVGEVRRVVRSGINGKVCEERTPEAFAATMAHVLDNLQAYSGSPALQAIEPYQPAQVLQPVYQNYLRLAALGRPRVVSVPVAVPVPAQTFAPNAALVSNALPEPAVATAENMPAADYPFRQRERVIGVPIDVLRSERARQVLLTWARARQSRYACFVNAHSSVVASREARHGRVIELADMALADGFPVAWTLRKKGHTEQQRLDGPGTMWQLCADAQREGVSIGLYGSAPETLRLLRGRLQVAFPALRIGFCHPPPFRALTPEEDEADVQAINASGIGLLFVSLGCPKQELWMADRRGRVNAVMLGVGAAFDFHAGVVSHAPAWLRDRGLEWLYRLSQQPRRLFGRYLDTNSAFIARSLQDFLRPGRQPAPALTPPVARAPVADPLAPYLSSQVSGFMNSKLDLSHLSELLVRVDAALSHRSGRLIEFIASGEGEGTTTLAEAYAALAVASMGRRVLVLTAHAPTGTTEGVLQVMARGGDMKSVITQDSDGFNRAGLLAQGAEDSQSSLLGRGEYWKRLRAEFDEVVLDMPATSRSRLGLMVAPQCDGVVVVVEAERTRAPVVESLVANLRAVKANLLGTVLNKRRFYLPEAVYRRL
jgi:exopolysaccharide biosynthesis WecB/TagA/CpsF family protein